MRILLNVEHLQDEYADECAYAVVDITVGLFNEIRRRIDLGKRLYWQTPSLSELRFWSSDVEFYPVEIVDLCVEAVFAKEKTEADAYAAVADWRSDLEGLGFATIPDEANLDALDCENAQNREMLLAITAISQEKPCFGVSWSALPKYENIPVITTVLSEEQLKTA